MDFDERSTDRLPFHDSVEAEQALRARLNPPAILG